MVYKLNDGGAAAYTTRSAEDYVKDNDGAKVPLVHNALLLDRFILAGTELKSKMEVRYKRSRNKTQPASNKDSLGAKDMEGKHFFEPTQELDFIRNLTEGRFNVLLLPTQVADIQRWQIFAHNSQTGRIDSFHIKRSGDGLFNTRGTQFYTSPDPQYQNAVFEHQSGKCPFTDQPLIPIVSKEGHAEWALEFGGTDEDYVKIETFAGFSSTAITVEFWARSDDPGSGNTTISYWTDTQDDRAFMLYDFRNQIVEINRVGRTTGVSFNDGQWHHVAVSWDSSDGLVMIYKDGKEEGSYTLAKGQTLPDGGCLVLGQKQRSLGGG